MRCAARWLAFCALLLLLDISSSSQEDEIENRKVSRIYSCHPCSNGLPRIAFRRGRPFYCHQHSGGQGARGLKLTCPCSEGGATASNGVYMIVDPDVIEQNTGGVDKTENVTFSKEIGEDKEKNQNNEKGNLGDSDIKSYGYPHDNDALILYSNRNKDSIRKNKPQEYLTDGYNYGPSRERQSTTAGDGRPGVPGNFQPSIGTSTLTPRTQYGQPSPHRNGAPIGGHTHRKLSNDGYNTQPPNGAPITAPGQQNGKPSYPDPLENGGVPGEAPPISQPSDDGYSNQLPNGAPISAPGQQYGKSSYPDPRQNGGVPGGVPPISQPSDDGYSNQPPNGAPISAPGQQYEKSSYPDPRQNGGVPGKVPPISQSSDDGYRNQPPNGAPISAPGQQYGTSSYPDPRQNGGVPGGVPQIRQPSDDGYSSQPPNGAPISAPGQQYGKSSYPDPRQNGGVPGGVPPISQSSDDGYSNQPPNGAPISAPGQQYGTSSYPDPRQNGGVPGGVPQIRQPSDDGYSSQPPNSAPISAPGQQYGKSSYPDPRQNGGVPGGVPPISQSSNDGYSNQPPNGAPIPAPGQQYGQSSYPDPRQNGGVPGGGPPISQSSDDGYSNQLPNGAPISAPGQQYGKSSYPDPRQNGGVPGGVPQIRQPSDDVYSNQPSNGAPISAPRQQYGKSSYPDPRQIGGVPGGFPPISQSSDDGYSNQPPNGAPISAPGQQYGTSPYPDPRQNGGVPGEVAPISQPSDDGYSNQPPNGAPISAPGQQYGKSSYPDPRQNGGVPGGVTQIREPSDDGYRNQPPNSAPISAPEQQYGIPSYPDPRQNGGVPGGVPQIRQPSDDGYSNQPLNGTPISATGQQYGKSLYPDPRQNSGVSGGVPPISQPSDDGYSNQLPNGAPTSTPGQQLSPGQHSSVAPLRNGTSSAGHDSGSGSPTLGYYYELNSKDRSSIKRITNANLSSIYGYKYGQPSLDASYNSPSVEVTDDGEMENCDKVSAIDGGKKDGDGCLRGQGRDITQPPLKNPGDPKDFPNKEKTGQSNHDKTNTGTGASVPEEGGKTQQEGGDKLISIVGYRMKKRHLDEIISCFRTPEKCILTLPQLCSGPLHKLVHLIQSYPDSARPHDGFVHMPSDLIVPLDCFWALANLYARDQPWFTDEAGVVLPSGRFVEFSTIRHILQCAKTPEKVVIVTPQRHAVPFKVYEKYIDGLSAKEKENTKVILYCEHKPVSYQLYAEITQYYKSNPTISHTYKNDTVKLLNSNTVVPIATFCTIMECHNKLKDATVKLPSGAIVTIKYFLKIRNLLGKDYTKQCVVNIPNTDVSIAFPILVEIINTYLRNENIDPSDFKFIEDENPETPYDLKDAEKPVPCPVNCLPLYSPVYGGNSNVSSRQLCRPCPRYYLIESCPSESHTTPNGPPQ